MAKTMLSPEVENLAQAIYIGLVTNKQLIREEEVVYAIQAAENFFKYLGR